MRDFLVQFINIFTQLMIFAIFARVIMSWIRVTPGSPIGRVLYEVTEPVLGLARRVTPRLGMLDLSPIIAFLGLDILRSILLYLLM